MTAGQIRRVKLEQGQAVDGFLSTTDSVQKTARESISKGDLLQPQKGVPENIGVGDYLSQDLDSLIKPQWTPAGDMLRSFSTSADISLKVGYTRAVGEDSNGNYIDFLFVLSGGPGSNITVSAFKKSSSGNYLEDVAFSGSLGSWPISAVSGSIVHVSSSHIANTISLFVFVGDSIVTVAQRLDFDVDNESFTANDVSTELEIGASGGGSSPGLKQAAEIPSEFGDKFGVFYWSGADNTMYQRIFSLSGASSISPEANWQIATNPGGSNQYLNGNNTVCFYTTSWSTIDDKMKLTSVCVDLGADTNVTHYAYEMRSLDEAYDGVSDPEGQDFTETAKDFIVFPFTRKLASDSNTDHRSNKPLSGAIVITQEEDSLTDSGGGNAYSYPGWNKLYLFDGQIGFKKFDMPQTLRDSSSNGVPHVDFDQVTQTFIFYNGSNEVIQFAKLVDGNIIFEEAHFLPQASYDSFTALTEMVFFFSYMNSFGFLAGNGGGSGFYSEFFGNPYAVQFIANEDASEDDDFSAQIMSGVVDVIKGTEADQSDSTVYMGDYSHVGCPVYLRANSNQLTTIPWEATRRVGKLIDRSKVKIEE